MEMPRNSASVRDEAGRSGFPEEVLFKYVMLKLFILVTDLNIPASFR